MIGRILHKSKTDVSFAGQALKVLATDGKTVVGEWPVVASADGSFSLPALGTDSNIKYYAGLLYQNTAFLSEGASFAAGQGSLTQDVTVMDVAPRSAELTIENLHVVLQRDQSSGMMSVSQVTFFNNPTDHVMLGAPNSTVTFPMEIPSTATQIQGAGGLMPSQVLAHQDRLMYRGPIYPGAMQAILKYLVNTVSPWTYKQTLVADAKGVEIFVPETGPELTAPQLSVSDAPPIQGKKYKRYAGGPFKAGEVISVEVGGVAGAGAEPMAASSGAAWPGAQAGAPDATRNVEEPFELPAVPMVSILTIGIVAYLVGPVARRRRLAAQAASGAAVVPPQVAGLPPVAVASPMSVSDPLMASYSTPLEQRVRPLAAPGSVTSDAVTSDAVTADAVTPAAAPAMSAAPETLSPATLATSSDDA